MHGLIEWLFDFESKRQIPRIMVILIIVCVICVFIPENIWNRLGVDVMEKWISLPEFLRFRLKDMENKNAAYVFWVMSPYIFFVNFLVYVIRMNTSGYLSYLNRREKALKVKNKPKDSWHLSLIFLSLGFILFYLLFVLFSRGDPSIFGDFTISKNRFALIIIHGGMLLYLFPIVFTILFTEIRAGLTNAIFDEDVK